MDKVLVIALGGTIGSVKGECISLDDNNLKILDLCKRENVIFEGVSPFSVLSENMSILLWQQLIDYIDSVDKSNYKGIIVLHGSDTLAFTSALLANAFADESIVVVAADKPIEYVDSNGVQNFNAALDYLLSGGCGVYTSYDGLMKSINVTNIGAQDTFDCIASDISPVNSKKIYDRNILIINSYVGIKLSNYRLDNVDAVLIGMYHSATAPEELAKLADMTDTPVYFATHKSSADYETAKGIKNIIFNTTLENAYIRLLMEK